MTIDIKYKKDIDAARKEVKRLSKAQDAVFAKLCRVIGIKNNDLSPACGVWDYVFNDTDWTIEFTTQCSYANKYKGEKKPTCGCNACEKKYTEKNVITVAARGY
jgi:hypothetical protein